MLITKNKGNAEPTPFLLFLEEMRDHMALWQRSPEGVAVALGPRVR